MKEHLIMTEAFDLNYFETGECYKIEGLNIVKELNWNPHPTRNTMYGILTEVYRYRLSFEIFFTNSNCEIRQESIAINMSDYLETGIKITKLVPMKEETK